MQLREPVDPEVYAAAPWWEQRIFDGGERVLRVKGEVQLSPYPSRFLNSLIVAITSTVLAVGMGTLTAYGFSRFRVAGGERLAVLHPLDPHAAAGGGRDPDVPDVPGRRADRHPSSA